MGDVVHLFGRATATELPSAMATGSSAEAVPDVAPAGAPLSEADRAQAMVLAQMLAECRSQIVGALAGATHDDPGQSRLDRAALRRDLAEVSDLLDTIRHRTV